MRRDPRRENTQATDALSAREAGGSDRVAGDVGDARCKRCIRASRLLAGALAACGGLVQGAVQEVATRPGRRGARDSSDACTERGSVRPAAPHSEGEHAVEHCHRAPFSVSNGEGIKKGETRWQHTSGDECLGVCLTAEVHEGERRAHTFEGAEVAVDH